MGAEESLVFLGMLISIEFVGTEFGDGATELQVTHCIKCVVDRHRCLLDLIDAPILSLGAAHGDVWQTPALLACSIVTQAKTLYQLHQINGLPHKTIYLGLCLWRQ